MEPNTHSADPPARHATSHPAGPPDELVALTAALERLATRDLDRLPDAGRAQRVLVLRRLLDQLEGHWLNELAGVDARGAAGAEAGIPAPSTASWLRTRLHMAAGSAHTSVKTARALFRGPLTQTATALTAGELSAAHASVLAHGTHDLPRQVTAEAEPVLVEAARRLDPPRLRQVLGHLQLVADPDGTDERAERQHGRRGLWLSPTLDNLVAIDGLLEPEAGQTLLAALEPLARPATAHDTRSGGQRRADALTELARRSLEGGQLPRSGGVRPQLTVIVDLDSLVGGPGGRGGDTDSGPLAPQACRRLACDGAVTRVLVTRHPSHQQHRQDPTGPQPTGPHHQPSDHHHHHPDSDGDGGGGGLAARLRAAAALLPPILGGAPTQPLEVGRTSRVVTPAQRVALAVRDGGCSFPGCDRPLAWCDAHHLVHWLDGGPTDLANLALLCRVHHRVVHEGGWRLTRGPDGRLTATPPHRQHRGHSAAA
jgi:Domain of unknown function (DUF222)/HNH endonuclease